MSRNKFMNALITQLAHHGEGDFAKFKVSYDKSLTYSGLHSFKGNTFLRYICFDFLISVGVLDTSRKNRSLRWYYLGNYFNFLNSGDVYRLNFGEDQFEEKGWDFVKSDYSIFPKGVVSDKKRNDLVDILKTLNLENFLENPEYIRELDFIDFSEMSLTQYDFKKKCWVDDVEEIQKDGFYKSKDRFNQQSFFVTKDGKRKQILNDEWAFVIASKYLGEKIYEVELGNSILIPWQFKLPSLFKRVLASISFEMAYQKTGIRFNVNSLDEVRVIDQLLSGAEI